VADLIAKCSYSFVGWYTRQVVLQRILDRKRAAKAADAAAAASSADADGKRLGGADGPVKPSGPSLGDGAMRALGDAPKSAHSAIARIARGLRAFGPDAPIVRHAVAGACDAASAGVAAAAPAIARSLLDAARRARQRRVVHVLIVDPDPLVHTAISARLGALASRDVRTGVTNSSAMAAASLLHRGTGSAPGSAAGSATGPGAALSRSPLLEDVAQSPGLPGIEVRVDSVFRLDDVPSVFSRGHAHFDCVVATQHTLRLLAGLSRAETHRRGLRVFSSAALRDQLTALTIARGDAAASLAAVAKLRGRSASARPSRFDPSSSDYDSVMADGGITGATLREEARRLSQEHGLGLSLKVRRFVSRADPAPAASPAPATSQAASRGRDATGLTDEEDDGDVSDGGAEARDGGAVSDTEGDPAAAAPRAGPESGGRTRRLSLTEAVTGTVIAADIRRVMQQRGLASPDSSGGAAASPSPDRLPAPYGRRGHTSAIRRSASPATRSVQLPPAPSVSTSAHGAGAGTSVSESETHPCQALFGLLPVVALSDILSFELTHLDDPSRGAGSAKARAKALQAELGADIVVSCLDDSAQWRTALTDVAREAAARGQAHVVKSPVAGHRGKRVQGLTEELQYQLEDQDSGSELSVASRSRRSAGRSRSRQGGRSQTRPRNGQPGRRAVSVTPASPAVVASMMALLRPAESVAAAREARIRRYGVAVRALARAMAASAVGAAGRAAARAALAGSLAANGMAYLYRDRDARRDEDARRGGAAGAPQEGTAALLPQLAIVLDDEASKGPGGQSGLVPTGAVEWRRGRQKREGRAGSDAEADGDADGPLSLSRTGRVIRRRDSAIMAMQGAFFDDGDTSGVEDLWEAEGGPLPRGMVPGPLPRGVAPGDAFHTSVPIGGAGPGQGPYPAYANVQSPGPPTPGSAGGHSNPMHYAAAAGPRGGTPPPPPRRSAEHPPPPSGGYSDARDGKAGAGGAHVAVERGLETYANRSAGRRPGSSGRRSDRQSTRRRG